MHPIFTKNSEPFPYRTRVAAPIGRHAIILNCIRLALPCLYLLHGTFSVGATVEGFTEPYQVVDISAAAEPGILTNLYVREGEKVSSGQILARLDTSVLESTLEITRKRAEMRGRILAAKTELQLRQRYVDNLRQLFKQQHASQAEMDRAELDLVVASASLQRAQEEQELALLEVKRAELEIERRVLRSPIDGIVTVRHRDVGEATQISDTRVLTLVQVSTLRVVFSVPIRESFHLQSGNTLQLSLPEIATSVEAQVELVAPVLDARSGTAKVTCVIDNQRGIYRSGMRCLLDTDAPRSTTTPTNQLTSTPGQ